MPLPPKMPPKGLGGMPPRRPGGLPPKKSEGSGGAMPPRAGAFPMPRARGLTSRPGPSYRTAPPRGRVPPARGKRPAASPFGAMQPKPKPGVKKMNPTPMVPKPKSKTEPKMDASPVSAKPVPDEPTLPRQGSADEPPNVLKESPAKKDTTSNTENNKSESGEAKAKGARKLPPAGPTKAPGSKSTGIPQPKPRGPGQATPPRGVGGGSRGGINGPLHRGMAGQPRPGLMGRPVPGKGTTKPSPSRGGLPGPMASKARPGDNSVPPSDAAPPNVSGSSPSKGGGSPSLVESGKTEKKDESGGDLASKSKSPTSLPGSVPPPKQPNKLRAMPPTAERGRRGVRPMARGIIPPRGGPMPVRGGPMSGRGGPILRGPMPGRGGPIPRGPMPGRGGPMPRGPMPGRGGPIQRGPMPGRGGPMPGRGGPMPRGPMPGRGGPMSGRGRPKPGGMLRMGGLPPPKPSKQKSPDGTMPGAKNSVTSPSSPPGPKGGPSAQGKLPPKRNKEVLRNQGTPGKRMPGRKMGVPVTGKLNLPLKPDGKRQPPGGNQEQKTSRGGQQSVFPSLVGFETNGTMTAGGGTGGRLIVAQGPAPSKEVKQSQASMTWYTLSTEEERKAYLIPQPSGRCGGGGEPFYNLHGPMPFYAGSALRSGRFILGGGGGQKGTGVGSGLCIFDVKKNCPLIPFASFDSNDRLISCIAEHPSGSEVVLSIDECVYAFLVTTDGEGFHLIDDWVVIPPNSPEKVNTSDPAEEVDPPQVTAIAFSFAGDLIATGGEDGQVRVWQYHSKQMVALFKVDEPENDVSSIALTPDSKFVLTCSNKTHCTVWSMADKKAFKQLKFSDVPDATFHNIRMVRTVSLVSDEVQESTFAVAVLRTPTRGGWSYLVKYDIASWEAVQATRVAQSRVAQSSVSNDGRLIAVSTVDGKIMIFDTTSFACIHTVKSFHNLPGTAICFSNDDKHLVSVSSDKSYALVPIEGIASKKSHGCTQAIVRTVLQILLVVIIAHIVTWNK